MTGKKIRSLYGKNIKTHKDLDVWKESMKLAKELGFINENSLESSINSIRKMLIGLIKYLSKNQ